MHDFTIENLFVESQPLSNTILHFEAISQFESYLKEKLLIIEKSSEIIPHDKAGPDESWQYDEYDLNCVSFCLPAKAHPSNKHIAVSKWMHDKKGIIINNKRLPGYVKGLAQLIQSINKDLNK
jgi:hypothetical protein